MLTNYTKTSKLSICYNVSFVIGIFCFSCCWALASSIDEANLLTYVKKISSDEFNGRKFASKDNQSVQQYIVRQLTKHHVKPFAGKFIHQFRQGSLFTDKQGANVIGLIEGSVFSDQFIVLSAHYDHLGRKAAKIYNGADDNASGTAALLSYAEELSKNPLKRSIILLFTDGEEVSLLGAKNFISTNPTLLSKLTLNINIDMIAGDRKTKKLHFITGDLATLLNAEQEAKFKLFQKALPIKVSKGFRSQRGQSLANRRTNWRMASDHGVFARENIPFIYFGVGTHQNYHSEHDTFENINKAFYYKAADSIYQQLRYLDSVI